MNEEDKENQHDPKGVDFGRDNRFEGSIGDIAGRDLIKSAGDLYISNYNSFVQPALDSVTVLENEIKFANLIETTYSPLEQYFVPSQVMLNVQNNEVSVPVGFKEGFSQELAIFLVDGQVSSLSTKQSQKLLNFDSLLEVDRAYVSAPLGFGKTTLLKMLALHSVREFNNGDGFGKPSVSSGKGIPRLPLYINMRFYNPQIPITEYIKNYAWRDPNTMSEIPEWYSSIIYSMFERYLAMGRFLLLLDSLDEVGRASQDSMIHSLINLANRSHLNHFICAGRETSIGDELTFPKALIATWQEPEIQQFFQKRLGRHDGENAFLAIRDKHPDLMSWIRIPYVAYAVALYYRQNYQIPPHISHLADKLVLAIMQRDIVNGSLSGSGIPGIERFLSEVAFNTMESDSGVVIINEESPLSTTNTMDDNTDRILSKAIQMGFLVKVTQPAAVAFPNRLLQQYFAGKNIINGFEADPTSTSALIRSLLSDSEYKYCKRSKLFTRPVQREEIGWDRPLPLIEPSRWIDALGMALVLASKEAFQDLVELIASSSTLAAAQIVSQYRLDVPVTFLGKLRHDLIDVAQNYTNPLRVRLSSLYSLGDLGDPRIGDDQMVTIPIGKAQLGAKALDQFIFVNAFLMDIFPVTNQQYREFVQAGGYHKPEFWTQRGRQWLAETRLSEPEFWRDSRYNSPNQPVVGVCWYEATAYSKWCNKRLPTEAEWERAATWDSANQSVHPFPTGNKLIDELGNVLIAEREYVFCTTPVGTFPRGRSNDGLFDLVGNVWEWLSTEYKDYPYIITDGREEQEGDRRRCLRGGSWGLDQVHGAVCTTRNDAKADLRSPLIGFRCAKSIK